MPVTYNDLIELHVVQEHVCNFYLFILICVVIFGICWSAITVCHPIRRTEPFHMYPMKLSRAPPSYFLSLPTTGSWHSHSGKVTVVSPRIDCFRKVHDLAINTRKLSTRTIKAYKNFPHQMICLVMIIVELVLLILFILNELFCSYVDVPNFTIMKNFLSSASLTKASCFSDTLGFNEHV